MIEKTVMNKSIKCPPRLLALALLSLGGGLYTQANAQTIAPPDAGQTLQQLQPPLAAPRESKPLSLGTPSQAPTLPGGATVALKSVSFGGNTVQSEAALHAALGDAIGKSFDLAGLRGLAERVGEAYRGAGYPFARAYLPPQNLQSGALRIEVIEGRYGKVTALSNDATLAAQAQPFLASLNAGAVIESAPLERATLILDEQPGIRTSPVIRPGTATGTGDLDVQVVRDKRFDGDVGFDNFGIRYSGYHRIRANVNLNSPFLMGDQISVRTLASDENLLLGSLGYAMPLGASGLRGQVGYANTSYTLGKEFASTQSNGTATVTSAGLSYPIVRSQKTNLSLAATYQAKDLKDNQDATASKAAKSSKSLPVTLLFDHRDDAGGGGITYGSVGWTAGKLQLDTTLTTGDINNTQGSFNKFNIELVRLQTIGSAWSLMGRLSLQAAGKNLDSSEKFSLGGATGVRAYPTGEANGDEGTLAQIELRYNAGAYAPYAFFDAGTIKTNAKPSSGATNNERTLAGAGFGLRYQRGNWNADTVLAWRTTGGVPQSDNTAGASPRIWVTAGYRF